MILSREDYVLFQQMYDRLTQMQAELLELIVSWKQEPRVAELQVSRTTGSKPKLTMNPDSCVKENSDSSGWVT